MKVGNNLNKYINFEEAEKYADKIKKEGNDRIGKSSKDALLGRLVEEIIIFLLENYFKENKLDYIVSNEKEELKELFDSFKIVNKKFGNEKKFDIDIIIKNKNKISKCFLISSKGTSRERMRQYLSHLFMMDDRVIKAKYGTKYFLEFFDKEINIKYKADGKLRETLKQTEVPINK